MGHIKEPKGIDFVVSSTPLTAIDRKLISDAIQCYKTTGKKIKIKESNRPIRKVKKKISA